MKRHLPNILLLLVVLTNLFFMGRYIRNNGMGMFLSTTGVVLLVLGIIIFIYFLSIDPGYGWTRSMDLSKNCIMIFASMAVGMTGVVLIVTGQHLNELYLQRISDNKRCADFTAGKMAEVLQKDWYSLQDSRKTPLLHVHLFQKKSDRNEFKIVATVNQLHAKHFVRDLVISSDLLPISIAVDTENETCPGVFEKNISIDFEKLQEHAGLVRFDLLLTIFEGTELTIGGPRGGRTVRFTLQSKNEEVEGNHGLLEKRHAEDPQPEMPALGLFYPVREEYTLRCIRFTGKQHQDCPPGTAAPPESLCYERCLSLLDCINRS